MEKTVLTDTKLTKKQILFYLEKLNEELKIKNENGEIIICGGTAMVLMYDARNSTKDIDALYMPKEEINEIVENFSDKYGISIDWLNDSAKVFFTPQMKTNIYKKYSNLIVKCFDTESLLALKLTSARNLTNDEKDALFLTKQLKIEDINEMYDIVEKYIPEVRRNPKTYYFIQEVFNKYKERNDKNE